ncbi:MAG: hypothetical protein AABZ47_12780 [Planctomycetota bacterium]
MCTPRESSLENATSYERRRRLINEFWHALYDGADAGAATWEALDRMNDRVTTALRKRPPDLCLAESLTAKAALMISLKKQS